MSITKGDLVRKGTLKCKYHKVKSVRFNRSQEKCQSFEYEIRSGAFSLNYTTCFWLLLYYRARGQTIRFMNDKSVEKRSSLE